MEIASCMLVNTSSLCSLPQFTTQTHQLRNHNIEHYKGTASKASLFNQGKENELRPPQIIYYLSMLE